MKNMIIPNQLWSSKVRRDLSSFSSELLNFFKLLIVYYSKVLKLFNYLNVYQIDFRDEVKIRKNKFCLHFEEHVSQVIFFWVRFRLPHIALFDNFLYS